jgi:hypothetical protein
MLFLRVFFQVFLLAGHAVAEKGDVVVLSARRKRCFLLVNDFVQ